MIPVKGLACRERVLLPQCVIYVIIIVIYLAQEGYLLEASGGHTEGSRGGLDPPPTSPLHLGDKVYQGPSGPGRVSCNL